MAGERGGGGLERTLTALALAAWFLAHTWRGLLCTLQADDVMNIYQAWILPAGRLALGNLTPFTTVYRPVGSVFYKLLFWWAGLHPLPYRLAIYALLLVNVALLYRFALLLTGSREAAAVAALLGGYHNHLMDLYQNGGTIYDILSYTFFLAAINCYVARQGRWPLRFIALAVLALNSKEMALTLPAVLWMYELVYRPPRAGKLVLWIVTLAAPAAALAKTAAGSPFYRNAAYQLHLNWAQWIETTRYWLDGLLLLPYRSLTATATVLVLLLPWAIAACVRDPERRKPFLLCAGLVWILPLPVNFIDQRGFFAMYLPLAAWSLIAAYGLVTARDWIAERLPAMRAHHTWARVALIVVAAVGLSAAQLQDAFPGFETIDPSQEAIRALAAGVAQNCPELPRDAYVEIHDDPFSKDGWDPVFVTRLWKRREDISVHRTPPASGNAPAARYDCTLAYRGGRFVAAR
jgi:hypothetical protein